MSTDNSNNNKLITAYQLFPFTEEQVSKYKVVPVPGNPKRDFMDESHDKFAYRCLPLTIANFHGWDFLCPCDVEVTWKGGKERDDLVIKHMWDDSYEFAHSHFGVGVLTFTFPFLFRTPPGYALMVQGTPNHTMRGATALQGVVETDWLPATFTMNWKMTEPYHTVTFKKGQPLCRMFPMKFPDIEEFDLKIACLEDEPELHAHYEEWKEKRASVIKTILDRKEDPRRHDHDYIKGHVGGKEGPSHHKATLKLATFNKDEIRRV